MLWSGRLLIFTLHLPDQICLSYFNKNEEEFELTVSVFFCSVAWTSKKLTDNIASDGSPLCIQKLQFMERNSLSIQTAYNNGMLSNVELKSDKKTNLILRKMFGFSKGRTIFYFLWRHVRQRNMLLQWEN